VWLWLWCGCGVVVVWFWCGCGVVVVGSKPLDPTMKSAAWPESFTPALIGNNKKP
jgi:hypothetical protein